MNIIKRFSVPICLALLGIGGLLLGAWDMQQASAAPQPEAWYQGTDLPLQDAFYGSAQCSDEPDSFYVVVGWQAWFDNRDEVWRYDANTSTWEELAPYPEEMGVPSITCYQGYLYSAGGNMEGIDTSWHFYRYEIASDTWTQLDNLLRKQNGAALVAWDGYLYMIGGDDAPVVPLSPTTQVDRYNIGTGIWEMNWGNPMPVATMGNWAQAGEYVYIVGGFTSNFPTNSDATLRYDLTNGTWESGPSFTSRRAMMTLVITSQYLYAIGGDANGGGSADETNQVERLDLLDWPGGSWVDIADPLPAPRAANGGFCTEAVTGGKIWSVAGLDPPDNPTTNIFYRPSEPCADFFFGDLQSENMELGNQAGETAHFVLPLVNNGTEIDDYNITASGVWTITVPSNFGPLDPGETGLLLVDVLIPPGPNPFMFDTGVVTVTSQSDPGSWDTALLTTSITDWEDIELPIRNGFHKIVQCPDAPDIFFMIGGSEDDLNPIDDLWRYDANSDNWEKLADLPITGWGGVAGCYQDKLYIGSGFYNLFGFGSFDLTSNTWTWLHSTPRWFYGAATGVWDGKLFVTGGYWEDPFIPTNEVNIYDIASNAWILGPSMPAARLGGGYAQAGPYLYVVGGISGDWNNNLDTTLRLNMATGFWESGPTFTSQRGMTALVTTQSHLYAIGGDENGGERMDPTGLVEALDLNLWPEGEWINLDQPLPWPLEGNGVACTGGLSGDRVWSVGGAYGSWHHPWFEFHTISEAYYFTSEPCVSYGIEISDPPDGEAEAGSTVEYMLTITNTGVVTDYYTLEVSTTWDIGSALGGPGPIGAGESIEIVVGVEVPQDGMWNDLGITEITAASISNPAEFDTTSITTRVMGFQVDINPDPPEPQAGHPGGVLTYTLQVTNLGDFIDSYTVTISTNWATVAPISVGPLLPGEETEMLVTVEIPEDANHADWDEAIITLTSQSDPRVSKAVTLTSAAFWHRMLIPLSMKN